jgi:23S rRNA (uracil1939-C5)-methyltransferase
VRPDVIVLDPPRKGCEERLLKTLVTMQPERIVYVSCDPTTLARDVRYLTVHGFKVVAVQPVDMFPHTAHVECVADIRQGH